jgi:UDP-N-acetylglucosamine--N-acetylmuramyl-(pentapeptide) pyrophosphoryl-undecaprenol N-acetylglucosamine transferase
VVTVLIAGGGTGGHVFPMLAVGDAIRAVERDADVFYVGTARGIESRVMKERGEDLELLDVAPLRGGGVRGFLSGMVRAARSLPAARKLVARRRPDVVLSVGGYAGGPVALAARMMGVPLAILEPNGVLGLSNKLLVPVIDRAYTGFGDLDRRLRGDVARAFGVPLRRAFERSTYQPEAGRLRVLVLGGSLGAVALNQAVPAAFAKLVAEVPRATIVHQTGRGRSEEVRAAYAAEGITTAARVSDFIDDVASELASADVVIQRAGASSLAELCAIGRPSILVPFPFAADQHQLANARSLEKAGAAVALPQAEATSERLARELLGLANDPARRERMAECAAREGKPEAARDIALDLLELSRTKKARS